MLPNYVAQVSSNDCALARIYGVFMIQCTDNYATNLILVENVSASTNTIGKYDLKGSTYNRSLSRTNIPNSIGKDLDFLSEIGKLALDPLSKETLLRRLKNDTDMLQQLNVMDYSMLLTVCIGAAPSNGSSFIYRSSNSNEYYMIALIDVMQEYNFSKKAETFWKHRIKRVNRTALSSIESQPYAERFMKFIEDIS